MPSSSASSAKPEAAAEHLGDVVDPAVAVKIAHQDAVVRPHPAGAFRIEIAVDVEARRERRNAGQLEPVAVEVEGERIFPLPDLEAEMRLNESAHQIPCTHLGHVRGPVRIKEPVNADVVFVDADVAGDVARAARPYRPNRPSW